MFRFTIRDVLWLTVVVAMGIDHREQVWRSEATRAMLNRFTPADGYIALFMETEQNTP